MKYSHNRNYRDSIIEEVEKTIKKLDDECLKQPSVFRIIIQKIKLYMSYLKLK
jgi:hypothetical protein